VTAGAPALARAGDRTASDLASCRRVIAAHSKSFALASRLFDRRRRDEVCAVYALCRRLDDAIDDAAPAALPAVLARVEAEVEALFADAVPGDTAARAFQAVARRRGIPAHYARELVAGFAMDARAARYARLEDLLLYAWRVAGTVGTMLCHVMGVADDAALPRAAHLGVAMQLTNVARDVVEDWERGRLYLPASLLGEPAARTLGARLAAGGPRQAAELAPCRAALERAVAALLAESDRYYASADRGLAALDRRAGLAVDAARRIYAAIGDGLRRRGDVLGPRLVVGRGRKLARLAGALAASAVSARARTVRPPRRVLRFEEVPLAPV
jgi:phytoene synthase